MPIPVQKILESPNTSDSTRISIIRELEHGVRRLLDGLRGNALTRVEIGDAFKTGATGVVGLTIQPELRELVLAIAQGVFPPARQAVKEGSDALDQAITNLVRRGAVNMAMVDLQAYFWVTPEG